MEYSKAVMETPNVDEEIKIKAYKELIEELNQQIQDKENIIDNLEVEWFKKYLLYEVSIGNSKNEYEKQANEIKEKIKNEEEVSINSLQIIIEKLKSDTKIGRNYEKR